MSEPLPLSVCPHCKEHIGLAPWEYRDLWEMLIASEHAERSGRVTLDSTVLRSLLLHIETLRAPPPAKEETPGAAHALGAEGGSHG